MIPVRPYLLVLCISMAAWACLVAPHARVAMHALRVIADIR